MKRDLCESLDVDDGDQAKEEGKPVLNSGHVGQQAALRQNLHHCRGNKALKLKLSSRTALPACFQTYPLVWKWFHSVCQMRQGWSVYYHTDLYV